MYSHISIPVGGYFINIEPFVMTKRDDHNKYKGKDGVSGDEVGREFDLVIRINLPYKNQIQVGYGHFWPDEFAKKEASNEQADWIFVQWQIKFSKGLI